jgi:hypothetical protein
MVDTANTDFNTQTQKWLWPSIVLLMTKFAKAEKNQMFRFSIPDSPALAVSEHEEGRS